MRKPWFVCIGCDRTKMKGKNTYTVIARGEGYTKEAFMCASCAELINTICENDREDDQG